MSFVRNAAFPSMLSVLESKITSSDLRSRQLKAPNETNTTSYLFKGRVVL